MKNTFATGVWDVQHKEKKTMHQGRDADGFMPCQPDWQEKWKEQMKNDNRDTF